jgi:hypothetical protein
MLTQFTFTESTTYADGTAIPAGTALTYAMLIDTVNPPVKAYSVPAANVAAAIAGVVTVKFTDIGFVPAYNTTYYADATEASGTAVSVPSNQVTFEQVVPPAAPTLLSVS